MEREVKKGKKKSKDESALIEEHFAEKRVSARRGTERKKSGKRGREKMLERRGKCVNLERPQEKLQQRSKEDVFQTSFF